MRNSVSIEMSRTAGACLGSGPTLEPATIFLHIPKCGGNSLLDFLRPCVAPGAEFDVSQGLDYAQRLRELQELSVEDRAALRFVHGHLPWGVHRWLPQPAVYVTLLRHPVDRLVSHHAFVLENPRHPLHATVHGGRLSLVDYVRSGLSGELENGQTRLLCGRAELDSLRGHGPVTREHFEEARAHLLGEQTHFGLVELYDASQQIIARGQGWPAPAPASRKNATQRRPPLDSISRRQWQAIVARNEFDMELYETAVRELARRAADCGVSIDLSSIPRGPAPLGRRLLTR